MKRGTEITVERALDVVARAPNYDRDHLVKHVQVELQRSYDAGHAAGLADAREHVLRELLAMARGLQMDANLRVVALERDLDELMKQLGKVTT